MVMIRIGAIDPFSQWDSGSPDLDGSYVIDGMELSLVREIMSRSASAYMITRPFKPAEFQADLIYGYVSVVRAV